MNIETAKSSIGKMVMSKDPGSKMVHSISHQHGPYKLLKITKGGRAIFEGRGEFRISPSLLEIYYGAGG